MITIGVLECGRNLETWLEKHGGFADWFLPFLRQAEEDLAFRIFKVDQGELPPDRMICDAWLLTGSPASVYDALPWQAALTRFIRAAVADRPLVGICYGHQHLHAALGGTVAKGEHWGTGIQTYSIAALPAWLPDELAEASAQGLRLIALHQDQVTRAAPDTRILAGNAACPLGITMIGENVLSFQAHPEMTPAQAREIYRFHRDDIGAGRADEAVGSLAGARDDTLAARWIVSFVRDRLARQNGDLS